MGRPRQRAGPARESHRDAALPRSLLLAARAVARPRGGADHSGRRKPDPRAGGQIARAVLIGATVLATLGALAAGAGARGGAHARAGGRAHPAAAGTHLQVTQVEYRLL